MTNKEQLDIAEIVNAAGQVVARYSRYLAPDGSRWVRNGPYVAYHANGRVASEVSYRDGVVEGLERDFYDNGQIAAEGYLRLGKEEGVWRFWMPDGTEQDPVRYVAGEEAESLPPS